MKRILIVLVMIAGSVFMANPALAAEAEPAADSVAGSQTQADTAPAEEAPKEEAPPADPAPAVEQQVVETPAADAPEDEPAPAAQAKTTRSSTSQQVRIAAAADKIDICHATSAETNPYIQESPNASGDLSGHLDHTGPVWYQGAKADGVDWGDIIPPFTFDGVEHSLNWTATGEAIFNNGCNPVDVVKPAVTPVTPTEHDIVTCGSYGSVDLPTTEGVVYAFDPAGPSPTEGAWKVVATPADSFVFTDGSVTEWSGDLGTYTTCAVILDGDDVPFCHATNAEGNPYTMPPASAAGIFDGHLDHAGDLAVWYPGAKEDGKTWGDIIPPFIYNGEEYSLNWNAPGAQIIWNNDCAAVLVTPESPTTASGCGQDGSVILPTTLGVKYEFTEGDGITGDWTVTATPEPGYAFTDDAGTSWNGVVVDPGECTVNQDAVPSISTVPTCGEFATPITNPVTGVLYEFTVGNGLTGPWEITASALSGFVLNGEFVFSGDAGVPADCPSGDDGDPSDVEDAVDDSGTPDSVDPVDAALPDTGGPSLGWLPFSGLLIVAGTLVLARRRTI